MPFLSSLLLPPPPHPFVYVSPCLCSSYTFPSSLLSSYHHFSLPPPPHPLSCVSLPVFPSPSLAYPSLSQCFLATTPSPFYHVLLIPCVVPLPAYVPPTFPSRSHLSSPFHTAPPHAFPTFSPFHLLPMTPSLVLCCVSPCLCSSYTFPSPTSPLPLPFTTLFLPPSTPPRSFP